MADPYTDIEQRSLDDLTEPAAESESLSQRAMATPPYLEGLNADQRLAVETLDGPVLVLAGAGTGKTRVLTTRFAHILHTRRARPRQVLAVTFTNKAAHEMKERIGLLLGSRVEGMPWLGTFHSIGAKILRRHAELVELRPDFTIIDTDDQIRLLKQLLQAENLDEKRWPARQLAWWIDRWKNRGLIPSKVPEAEAHTFANGRGASLYAHYQQRLKVLNAADFGDLLLECLRLFQDNPAVLKEYQQQFVYMLVDEYQDTNIAQYLWLRLLAQGHHNLCCVGDDDQSIYGWRGAEVDNILRFEKDFPGAAIIRLEQNYRSSQHILGAASGLIAANAARLGKTLWTPHEGGEKLYVRGVWDSEEEARLIADDIETYQRDGHALDDMAILVRASFQMREFEDRFVNLGIPYRVVGGPRFYERMEIRDAIAYLRVLVQPDDGLAFERIANRPKRGLGEATMQMIHRTAREAGVSLARAALTLIQTDELKPKPRKALADLLAAFERWRRQLDAIPHTELAETVLEESGYTEMWQNDRSADAPGRLENLKELIRSMEEFENLPGFLEHISLVMDTGQDDAEDKVNLMTLHSAKGLEFRTVFLPGWEEGLFPHQRTLDENGAAGLEEERRLAYVGLTRARERVKVSFAANRRMYNLWQTSLPSRFIDELPPAHVEVETGSSPYGSSPAPRQPAGLDSAYESPGWRRARQMGWNHDAQVINLKAEAVRLDDADRKFHDGERIFHQKFGYGRIEAIDGNKLTVSFEKAGRKKVIASFVEPA